MPKCQFHNDFINNWRCQIIQKKMNNKKKKTAENPVKNLNDKEIFGKFFQWILSAANRKPKQTRTIVDVIELNISVHCDAGNGKMISSTGIYIVLSMSFVCSMYNVHATCDKKDSKEGQTAIKHNNEPTKSSILFRYRCPTFMSWQNCWILQSESLTVRN